ncbi:hypothetical protein [Massilia sp. CF038]|uniref:hypothetical protein n=1 Tax=Massilia sp. CF038 TaxID=1881045 RepID=UPI00092058AF|nr:hypothetical protein [Massilia sp. CF038]SHG71409.1 hypothetical protein SAMN05428948_1731 [Massilia sp. CF038]
MRRQFLLWPVLCAALGIAPAAPAQEIGRLFTTPAQRAALDRARAARPADRNAAVTDSEAPVAVAETPLREGEQVLMVNGVVRRSGSGRDTIWVNDTPLASGERLPSGATVAQGRNGTLAVTLRSGKRVTVKPGQNVDAVSGNVRESTQAPAEGR